MSVPSLKVLVEHALSDFRDGSSGSEPEHASPRAHIEFHTIIERSRQLQTREEFLELLIEVTGLGVLKLRVKHCAFNPRCHFTRLPFFSMPSSRSTIESMGRSKLRSQSRCAIGSFKPLLAACRCHSAGLGAASTSEHADAPRVLTQIHALVGSIHRQRDTMIRTRVAKMKTPSMNARSSHLPTSERRITKGDGSYSTRRVV